MVTVTTEMVCHHYSFLAVRGNDMKLVKSHIKCDTRAALQIQDQSPKSRPVTSHNQSQMQLT